MRRPPKEYRGWKYRLYKRVVLSFVSRFKRLHWAIHCCCFVDKFRPILSLAFRALSEVLRSILIIRWIIQTTIFAIVLSVGTFQPMSSSAFPVFSKMIPWISSLLLFRFQLTRSILIISKTLIGVGLHLCREAVGAFYSPRRPGKIMPVGNACVAFPFKVYLKYSSLLGCSAIAQLFTSLFRCLAYLSLRVVISCLHLYSYLLVSAVISRCSKFFFPLCDE